MEIREFVRLYGSSQQFSEPTFILFPTPLELVEIRFVTRTADRVYPFQIEAYSARISANITFQVQSTARVYTLDKATERDISIDGETARSVAVFLGSIDPSPDQVDTYNNLKRFFQLASLGLV